jgi:hypothetical protein
MILMLIAGGIALSGCGSSPPSKIAKTACTEIKNTDQGAYTKLSASAQSAEARKMISDAESSGIGALQSGAAQLQSDADKGDSSAVESDLSSLVTTCSGLGLGPTSAS